MNKINLRGEFKPGGRNQSLSFWGEGRKAYFRYDHDHADHDDSDDHDDHDDHDNNDDHDDNDHPDNYDNPDYPDDSGDPDDPDDPAVYQEKWIFCRYNANFLFYESHLCLYVYMFKTVQIVTENQIGQNKFYIDQMSSVK